MPVVDVQPLSGTLILDKNKLRTLPHFVQYFKGWAELEHTIGSIVFVT